MSVSRHKFSERLTGESTSKEMFLFALVQCLAAPNGLEVASTTGWTKISRAKIIWIEALELTKWKISLLMISPEWNWRYEWECLTQFPSFLIHISYQNCSLANWRPTKYGSSRWLIFRSRGSEKREIAEFNNNDRH